MLHGIGLGGEHPYVPVHRDGQALLVTRRVRAEHGCGVESYIGDAASGQGVKLEEQYLITDSGVERLTGYPFEERLITTW